MAEPPLAGRCDPAFAAVAEAVRENLATRGDLGAAVAVEVGGHLLVDLWGGWADAPRTRPWREDTVVNLFSVGKALSAVCALRLVETGALDLDAPVGRYWPELVAGRATVRELLSHQAGLPAVARELPLPALYDWHRVIAALSAQEPWWEPGTGHGYHVHTYGFLVGELVRRGAGETVGAIVERELPAELWFGLPERHRGRRAEFVFTPEMSAGLEGQRHPLRALAYANPSGASGLGTVNTDLWLDAELPSVNAHGSARSIARLYTNLLTGALLGPALLAEATLEAASGPDLILGRPSRFGLGFQLTQPERPLGPNPRSFGHFGAGGALGFADPDADLAFGYVMNRGGPRWRNPRNASLIEAVYASL